MRGRAKRIGRVPMALALVGLVVGLVAWGPASFAAASDLPVPPSTSSPTDDATDAPSAPDAATDALASPAAALSRADVVAGYRKFVADSGIPAGWTGSVSACRAGTVSAPYQQATLDTLNYMRSLAGLARVTFDPVLSAKAQKAALVFTAGQPLTHQIPTGAPCYSADAAEAAASSNLYSGRSGASAIAGYMTDPGDSNTAAGHRRWVLYPPATTMGSGSTGSANALWVFGGRAASGTYPNPAWVSWPTAGYFPGQLLPELGGGGTSAPGQPGSSVQRWSLSSPNGYSFASARVTVTTAAGTRLSTTPYAPANGYGDNTFVWDVSGVGGVSGPGVKTFTVAVTNIVDSRTGSTLNHSYTVQVIDGTVSAAPSTADAAAYTQALYRDYLDRTPAASELDGWAGLLAGGAPRTAVSDGFVNSDEYRLIRIDAAYRDILGRSADAPGRAHWLANMKAGRITTDDIETQFYASAEYFRANGGTNTLFAKALYGDLLHRDGSASDYAFWGRLAAQNGRDWVIAQFWNEPETIGARVSAMYERYLGRAPDAAGLASWVGLALAIGDSGLRSGLTSSDEYFARAQARYPH